MYDPYENTPTATVYDVFADTATRLAGLFVHLSDTAPTAEEREEWWRKVMALRDAKRAVPARDREQLMVHIERWRGELARLEGDPA
ncbi:hypothetical protein ACGFMM_15425 [Streptomyces sp. NPDC048604]|uniref:hypothetical protein n=1 Tax=Streptomyces sp. NPDC048604 TaxID=3365578 RepID=UPI0037118C73